MIEMNHPLAQEFFFVFSRFEYALKMSDYLRRNPTEPRVDWRRFATSLEHIFSNPPTGEFAEAIEYLRTHPPKKQIVIEGRIAWSNGTPQTNFSADLILLYVRRVRNNLFHGGKFRQHRLDYQERTPELLRHSLIVVDACLGAAPDVFEAYYAG